MDKTDKERVLDNIETRMNVLGMNPHKLCVLAGLPIDTYRDMKRGKLSFPRMNVLAKIAKTLRISIADLMYNTKEAMENIDYESFDIVGQNMKGIGKPQLPLAFSGGGPIIQRDALESAKRIATVIVKDSGSPSVTPEQYADMVVDIYQRCIRIMTEEGRLNETLVVLRYLREKESGVNNERGSQKGSA